MKSLVATLSDLATARPWTVLMQGRDYWRIEALIRQARKDEKSETHLKRDAYRYEITNDKAVVYELERPILWEPGAQ